MQTASLRGCFALIFGVALLALSLTAPVCAAEGTAYSLMGSLEQSSADTAAADTASGRRLPYTMDELKMVLGRETGEKTAGGYVAPKNGRLAMLCAALVPGLGQMYNEKPLKAAIGFGLETVYLSRILLNWRSMVREERARDAAPVDSYLWGYHDGWASEYRARSVDWIWYSGAVVLALMVDAYVDAHLFDMRFKVGAAPNGDALAAQIAFEF